MKRNINRFGKATMIAAMVALGVAAQAQTGSLYLTAPYTASWDWSSNYFSGEGGPFVGTFTPNSGPPVIGPTIMYCTSVNDDFSSGQTFPVTLSTAPPSEAGWLVTNIVVPILPSGTDWAAATGLQLAIWATTPTSGYTFHDIHQDFLTHGGSGGAFSQTYYDYAADLMLLDHQTAAAYNFNYNGSGQPQIAPIPGGPSTFIQPGAPGPAAVIPFALGLVGRVRRRNKARKA